MKNFTQEKTNEGDLKKGAPESELGQEKALEKKFEQHEIKVDTVGELIDELYLSWKECEDASMKGKITLQIMKIRMGLMAAGLGADEIYVRQMPEGTLGLYDSRSNKIEISEDLLEDFNSDRQLIKTVFVHEETHKEGIHDEGLTQLKVKRRTTARGNFYEAEQQDAKRTFYKVGLDKTFKLYNINDPKELFNKYLEVGLRHKYLSKKKDLADKNKLEKIVKYEKERMGKEFKEGAPNLYKALKARSYNVKDNIEDILEKLAEKY